MNKWLVIHIKKGETKMGNEIIKTEKRELTGTVKFQAELANELDVASEQMGASFSDYGKKCVVNAIAGLAVTCTSQGISLKDLDPTILKLALQNVGYTELNYAAIPSEIYFDLRKITIWCDTENIASRKHAEKNGYVLEGVQRERKLWPDGSIHSTAMFGKLKTEWKKG